MKKKYFNPGQNLIPASKKRSFSMLFFAILFLLLANVSTAQSQGPFLPANGASLGGAGNGWNNAQNIDDIVGGNYATNALGSNETTELLRGTGFGFTIPLTATITGIELRIRRASSGSSGNSVRDVVVRLVKGGTVDVNDNKALTGTNWPFNAIGEVTYGSPTDLWNTTWTPAQINAANFGAVLSARTNGTSRTAYVDCFRITVYYTNGPTITSFSPTNTCAGNTPTVTINGTGFTGATGVTFNGTAASSFTVVSATQITAVFPTGGTTGQIAVTTPSGTANTSALTPSVFTVNPLPTVAAIAGNASVCVGATTPFTNATSGGTWSSDTPALASVNASGVVSGIAPGTATIRYTYSNGTCSNFVTSNITVNSLPVLSGATSVCMGSTVQLSPTSGGTWTSNNPTIATIDNSGNITTVAPGTATFTFTNTTTNCSATTGTFTVRPLPYINSQPVSQSACTGNSVSFSVGATVAGFTYQWYNGATALTDGSGISGATLATLTIDPVAMIHASTDYHCEVSGICSPSVVSNSVSLTVNERIAITTQPAITQAVCSGQSVTFSVAVTGDSPTFQWYNGGTMLTDGSNISGSTTNILTINPVNVADASANYHCVVSGIGACLPVTSNNAALIVNETPVIQSNPVALNTVCDDDPVSLSILATGGSLTYQWYKGATPIVNGGNISGANTDTLNFVPIHVGDAATDYYCVVTNSCSSVTSTLAEVVVNLKPKISNYNASTCSNVGFSLTPVNGVPDALTIVPAGTTYTWNAPAVTGGMTGGQAQSGQSSIFGTLTNTTNTVQTATYTVTPTSGTAGFCVGNPFTVTVAVNPVADIINYTLPVCSGELLTLTPANGGGNTIPAGTTYSWGMPAMSGGLSGATSGSAATSFSQTLTNSSSVSQTATYTVTPTSGSCVGTTFTIIVTVNPKPTLAISLPSQTICSGAAITAINFTNPNAISGTVTYIWTRDNTAVITGIAASGSGPISGTLTSSSATPQTTTFTIYASSDQSCLSIAGTATVMVSPNPVVSAISNQTICSGNNITTVNPSSSVSGTTYTWTRTNTTNITGIPNGTGTSISGSLTNITNTPQVTTFTVTPTANGCTNASGATTFSVTVNPSTSVTATPATQIVCGGANFSITASETNGVSGTTYSFTKDSNVTGDAVSITGNVISGSLENAGPADRVVTFTITATANGCPSTTTVTVTVRPNPAFVLTPSTYGICNGGALNITFPVVSGITYSWTRTDSNPSISGLPASGSGPITAAVLNNPTTTNQNATYLVTATHTSGCTRTQVATVTVYPTFTAPTISDTQTVCVNSRPTPFVMTTLPNGGTGTYTYQWQSSTANPPTEPSWANVVGGTGATTPSYWAPTTNNTTPRTHYRLVVTNTCGGSITSTNYVTVSVTNNQNFVFSVNGGSATVCSGAAFNPQIASGEFFPDSYIRYTWAADANYITPVTGGPIGTTQIIYIWIFPVGAISSATLPLTTTNNTGAPVTTTVYITPNVYDSDTNAFICSLSPQAVNVTILPRPTTTITAPTPGMLICSGTSAGVTAVSNMTGTFTVTRNVNANVTSSGALGVPSASYPAGTPFTFNDNLTNLTNATIAITYTVVANSTAGCPSPAQTIVVNVAPRLLPGTIGTNHTICYGGDPSNLTQTSAATNATSYTWEYSTDNVNWTTIPGAIGTSYDPPAPLYVTTWYRRVAATSAAGIPCTVAVTTPVQVTVNTLTAGVISATQTVCNGSGAITLTGTAGTGLPTISYQWQSNTTGCGDTFSNAPGTSNGINYTIPAGLATTTYYRRLTRSSAGTCEVASNCVIVYVNNVTGGTVGNDEVLCNTTNPSAFAELTPSTGQGTLSYQWQSTTNAAGCAAAAGLWTDIPFATLSTYDAPAGVTVTTYYRRVTTSTLNGVQCTALSNCITVTANSVTAGTIGPNSRTVCSGGDPSGFNSTAAGTGTGIQYQWQSSPTGAVGTWTDIPAATGLNYDPPGPVTSITYYRRVATATVGASTCQAFTTAVIVYVNDVTAPVMGGNQSVCGGEDPTAFTISTPASGSGTLTYQWQSNTTGCGGTWTNVGGANGATYDPPVLTQTTYYHVIVTSTLNGVACTATSNCITVTNMSKVWNGSFSNDWNNGINWTPNGIPTASNCVVIPNVSPSAQHAVISGSNYIGYALNLTVLNGGILEITPGNNLVVTDRVAVNLGGTFNILDSANLVQTNNVANTGIVNMQRITQPMYRFDYTYWNSPMVMGSYTLGDLSQNLTQPDKYYSWNPSISNGNGGWVQESAATIMNPTKGYIVRAPNTFSFTPTAFQPYTGTFTGTPNNGDIPIPIRIGTLGAGTTNDKLQLIGNPFTSAVSALAFVNDPTNVNLVDGTLYFWTHHAPPSAAFPNPFYGTFTLNYSPNGYASLNALGGTNTVPAGYVGPTPNDHIASGQSFFIVGKGTGTAYFRNSMRRTGNNSAFFRTSNPYASSPTTFESHRIWLNLADTQGSFSQILVGYADGATDGHDRNYDGESFSSSGISLYSINEDRKYGIQGYALPFDVNDIIPLGYNSTVAREFTIGIDHLDGLFDNQNVYLEDKLLNVIHDIKQSAYTFTTGIGMFNDRFVLRFTNQTLGVDDPEANVRLVSFIKDKHLHIRADRDIESVQVYDVSGKLVKTYTPAEASRQLDEEFVFAQGIYFAKIRLADGIIVTSKLSNGN